MINWSALLMAGSLHPEIIGIDSPQGLEAEVGIDLTGGAGLIECVEMNAGDFVIQEIGALFGGVVEADATDGFGIVAGTIEGFEEAGGESAAGRQIGHTAHAGGGGDRHDSGDDRDLNAGQIATLPEVVEIVVVEEELGADVVGPGVDFCLEVVHFQEAIWRDGVSFRKSGHADAEAAGIGMAAGVIKTFDEFHKIGGVGEGIVGTIVVGVIARGVTAQREDIADSCGGVAGEDFIDFLLAVTDACEVGNGIEDSFFLDADHEVVGHFTGCSACAVSHTDKIRGIVLQIGDGGVEFLRCLGRFRGEEFEREGGGVLGENIGNMHDRGNVNIAPMQQISVAGNSGIMLLQSPPMKSSTSSKPSSAKIKGNLALQFGHAWDYAPAPESIKVPVQEQYELFIGGKFVKPKSRSYFPTINPANEKVLTQVARANAADVNLAVAAARKAYDTVWSKTPGSERGKYLYRIARMIQEKARELAVLETMNGGKPIKESRDVDLPLVAAHFFYYAGWADKLQYALPGRTPRSLGVAGQIIPWNFPLLMAAWKIAPALACGNTVVLKPAETTPLTALHLAKIFQEAGLPDGVVNIVTGAGETGAALVDHPGVDKIAFTGSTPVGKWIAQATAGTNKRLSLELGGKAANIIFADAPLDQAVEGIVSGIYFNQGHVCCAGSRLLVEESVVDQVVRKLKDRLNSLRVGDPLDKNTDLGAINSAAQLARIQDLVASGVAEGAELTQSPCELPKKGFWFKPSFFTKVTASHRIAREEIFGPVLSIMTFRTPDEAIERANNTCYGLSAGIWTDKGSKIFKIASKLKAGVVWANTYNKFDPTSPFGGYKESGFGREGGLHGLLPYLAE